MSSLVPLAEARTRAYLTIDHLPDLFQAVAHQQDVWAEDPFDVSRIHLKAREEFQALIRRSTPEARGKILLLRGESGSGKTHLMGAFRSWLHGGHFGLFSYMQMTSEVEDYTRYMLENLIESLDRPYRAEANGPDDDRDRSALAMLADGVCEGGDPTTKEMIQRLRSEELDGDATNHLVAAIVERLVRGRRLGRIDSNMLSAFVYLQADVPYITQRVVRYLRCEELDGRDRAILGDITFSKVGDTPRNMIKKLGQLAGVVLGLPLVICLDQLEVIWEQGDASGRAERFGQMMGAVTGLSDQLPGSVIVIACLDDYYTVMRQQLNSPTRDRIERDPPPIRLVADIAADEVVDLVGRRLEALVVPGDADWSGALPTEPLPIAEIRSLAKQRVRDVLHNCSVHRRKSAQAGRILPFPCPLDEDGPGTDTIKIQQLWNDSKSNLKARPPEDEPGQAGLLAWGLVRCADELPDRSGIACAAQGRMLDVDVPSAGAEVRRIRVGICNKSAKGNGLANQVRELVDTLGDRIPIVARGEDFPKTANAKVNTLIAESVTDRGGRRVVINDADWRTMVAFQSFQAQHGKHPDWTAWLLEDRPLSRLKSIREILGLDSFAINTIPNPVPMNGPSLRPGPPRGRIVSSIFDTPGPRPLPPAPVVASPPPPIPPVVVPPQPPIAPPRAEVAGEFEIGRSNGRQSEPVWLTLDHLTRHSAFLGGSGSGKTTAALSLIEQALMQGIPTLLIDRKGDLVSYADPAAWQGPCPDTERRNRLRERIEVSLFTPGRPEGRSLALPVVPVGLGMLDGSERDAAIDQSAAALAGMLSIRGAGGDAKLAVLKEALRILVAEEKAGGIAPTLDDLIELAAQQDQTLINAIGHIDLRNCARLVQDLEVMRRNRRALLDPAGEPLDAERLLGLGPHATPGKTRLSIISTKFVGDNPEVQFFVARLLIELARWVSRSPSPTLQALVMFDEADLYLPANNKPASKEPMENLLRRARSAGLGLMLASQSPGDFDYRCRDNIRNWLVGRVQATTALNKMRPMLAEARTNVADRLAGQGTGEFHLLRDGEATALMTARSLISAEQRAETDILKLAAAGRPTA